MAFYPSAASGMNQSQFQSKPVTGPSQGPVSIGNNSFLGVGLPGVVPSGELMRPPLPSGRHVFQHPFNRPYPKPGQDRSDYDSKHLRKSSMRKSVDYYSSVIRMLEVFTNVYLYFTNNNLYLLGIIFNWILDESLAARRQRQKKPSTRRMLLPRNGPTLLLPGRAQQCHNDTIYQSN